MINRIRRGLHAKRHARGSSLLETLISVTLLALILVSILSGFAQQQASTRKNTDKNAAIILGEARLEELIKFPADQLQAETYVDYVVQGLNKYEVYDENAVPPTKVRQFRRTTTISLDPKGQLAYIRVVVEYGQTSRNRSATDNAGRWVYPYQVGFSTRRMLK